MKHNKKHTFAAPRPSISTVFRSISPSFFSSAASVASGGGINTALSSVDSSAYRGDKFGMVDLTPARPVDDGAKASEVWAATAKTAMVATRDLLGMVLGGRLFNSVKIENYDKVTNKVGRCRWAFDVLLSFGVLKFMNDNVSGVFEACICKAVVVVASEFDECSVLDPMSFVVIGPRFLERCY